MAWIVRFNAEQVVDFDDLAPETFAEIATHETDASWWAVYTAPGTNPSRLYRVIAACATFAGIDAPAEPSSMRDAKALLDMLDMQTPIEDRPVVDGFPQEPSAPENGSISGALGDSDGPEPKPELSRSVSS